MEALYEFGISLIQALQNFSPALDGLMEFFSFLGTIEFYILIVPLFYWSFSAILGKENGQLDGAQADIHRAISLFEDCAARLELDDALSLSKEL